jgi:hypothetical protein
MLMLLFLQLLLRMQQLVLLPLVVLMVAVQG